MDPITLKKAKDYTDQQIRSVDNNAAAEYAMQQGDYAKAEADKVQPKLVEVESVLSSANQTIESMEQATIEANQSADYALEQGDYAKSQGSLVEGKLEEADQAISTANQSAANADEKAEIAQHQASLVDDKLIEMETALSSIGESTSLAEQAAGQAESQAQYAKEQGDYAKQQGDLIQDALDGNLVTSVNGKSGEVQLAAADVGAETVEGSQDKANQAEQNAKDYTNQQLENFSTVTTWDELEDKPTEFTPSSHGHLISEVEGLQEELNEKITFQTVQEEAAAAEQNAIEYTDQVTAGKQNSLGFTPVNKAGDEVTGNLRTRSVQERYLSTENNVALNFSQFPLTNIDFTTSGSKVISILNTTTYHSNYSLSGTAVINQHSDPAPITWNFNVKWKDGQIPDLSGASKTYVLTFVTYDQGASWLGCLVGEF
ncbi:hypothetical protein M3689_07165 [Alkalihalophilus marmarensis]|uniref:Uncharacterized protein n=1 Tax=Alkalihalophilus marmarensis DSM 21297 TaxID=1188261 RepID=U6SN87_9BACI|nr:hypothetical protein [Alkalihalophilus marmarensis]ERN52822.1 hypothetical protein A33I_14090 [Alkalihalophilus marmarensis DSM 21297]MCM3489073.1 hypothetical protein [Alkalihalophilus marmarensis]